MSVSFTGLMCKMDMRTIGHENSPVYSHAKACVEGHLSIANYYVNIGSPEKNIMQTLCTATDVGQNRVKKNFFLQPRPLILQKPSTWSCPLMLH